VTSFRVTVDHDVCVGTGRCVADAPNAFELDEDQHSRPLPAAEELGDDELLVIARNCPTGAIVLTGADGKDIPLY
jgi:ferredoxin